MKFKSALAIALAATLCVCMTACNPSEGERPKPNGDSSLTGSLTVRIVDRGYGSEWLKQIAESYEATHKGCKVKVDTANDDNAVTARAATSSNDADIIVTTQGMYQLERGGNLVDLTDVYDSVQEGYTVPLKERMNQTYRDYFETSDNKFYQMPWIDAYAGFLYNKTSLDKALGEGKYKLPNTTHEFEALCKQLKDKGLEPISMSTAEFYYNIVEFTWMAQYMGGLEAYNNMLRGYYLNDSGEYVPCASRDDLVRLRNDKARTVVGQAVIDLVGQGKYAHSESNKMNFTDAQNAFLGLGYGTNSKECGFYLCGDWFANEMKVSLESSGSDVRFMRTVVLSEIVDTLETKITDAQLSKLIDAIDAGETSYDGISQKDFDRVKEARFMSYAYGTWHTMAIPKIRKGGAQYDLAKDFLKYIVTDEMQAMFAQTEDGLVMPYGYDATRLETEYGLQLSEYARSIAYAKGEHMNVVSRGLNSLFGTALIEYLFELYFEAGAFKGTLTAEQSVQNANGKYNFDEALTLIVK